MILPQTRFVAESKLIIMKGKKIVAIVGAFILAVSIVQAQTDEEKLVKETVLKAVDAMYNQGDAELINKYYHPGYELLMLNQYGQLSKIPLYDRIAYVEYQQKEGQFPPKEAVTIKFEILDVAVSTATVKFDYFRADRHTCIDIMCLYKFGEDWKIVSQTTHHLRD